VTTIAALATTFFVREIYSWTRPLRSRLGRRPGGLKEEEGVTVVVNPGSNPPEPRSYRVGDQVEGGQPLTEILARKVPPTVGLLSEFDKIASLMA
jgi:hypothetical protein